MNKNTIVISAYPCCGKTYAFENYQGKFSILDSDSSKFSWIERKRTPEELEEIRKAWDAKPHRLPGVLYIERIKDEIIKVRNPNFIKDYITHIKENIGKVDFIFVSSHLEVRKALNDEGIIYVTVYPGNCMLNEWVGRMYRRGSDKKFIDFQIEHWDEFTKNIVNEPHGIHLFRLGYDEYIDLEKIQYWYKYLMEQQERREKYEEK